MSRGYVGVLGWVFSAMLSAMVPEGVLAADFGYLFEGRAEISDARISALEIVSSTPPLAVAAAGDEVLVFGIEPRVGSHETRVRVGSDVRDISIHGPSSRLAVVTAKGRALILDLGSLRTVVDLGRAHKKGATSVAFSHDGQYLVTGGQKGDLRLFTAQGLPVGELEEGAMGHERRILRLLALSPGRRMLSIGDDRRVILWDLDTRRAIRPTLMDMDIRSAGLGGPGTLALGLQLLRGNLHRSSTVSRARETRVTDTVRVIDPRSGTRVLELEGSTQDLDSIAVTPDGRFIATAGSRSLVTVFDSTSGQVITEMPLGQPATAMAFGPKGRYFLVGGRGGSVALFELTGVVPPVADPAMAPAPITVVLIEPKILVSIDRSAGSVPRVDRGSLEIRGRVRSDAPLKSLQVDGQEITSWLPVDDDLVFTAFVGLPEPGRRKIDIVAENMAGAIWKDTFLVERQPVIEPAVTTRGVRRALIVGVSEYADPSINLGGAARDARAIHDFLTSSALGPARFEDENVMLLVDRDATVTNINRGLREFLQRARENDFVLVFFAGHGMPDPNQLDDFYLLAHDTRPQHVAGTGLPMHHVREALAQIRSRDVLILTDSCHSAGVAAPRGMRNLRTNPIHESFLEKMRHTSGGLAILTASEAAQLSLEGPDWGGHGVFTYFLLRGLGGAADTNDDSVVVLGELMEYVRSEVMKATSGQQVPAIGSTSFDREFPLVPVESEGH